MTDTQTQPPGRPAGRHAAWVVAGVVIVAIVAFVWSSRDGDDDNPPGAQPQPIQPSPRAQPEVSIQDRVADEYDRIDPQQDGWNTEAFADEGTKRLGQLADVLEQQEPVAETALAGLIDADCAVHALRPAGLEKVFQDANWRVLRPANPLAVGATSSHGSGRAAVVHELRQMMAPLWEVGPARASFKLFRVNQSPDSITTAVYYHGSGHGENEAVQQNALWHITWSRPTDEDPPEMTGIEVESFEEIALTNLGGRWFSDCTMSVIGDSRSFREQLLPGLNHWSRRIHSRFGFEPTGYQGVAVGDVNGDGLDDVYVCQVGGLPNRLYVQQPDGGVVDRSAEAGVDWIEGTRAALWVDLDNDGDQDLALTTKAGLVLMRNDGAGRFPDHQLKRLPGDAFSLVAADYDQDGDLDLYVCCYGNVWGGLGAFEHHVPMPMQDANNGSPNVLWRNEGDWTFTNATQSTGLDVNNRRWSLSATWEDYDNDGDQDLYVANDFGRNNLYRNDGGRFTDVAAKMGVEDLSPGMSAFWGDSNNDGWMDLYVSNMFSGAGNRITFQDQFQTGATEARPAFQRMAKGNSLYVSDPSGEGFLDASEAAGVTVGRWAWGSRLLDLNNDGLQDIVVANGFLTQDDTGDL